MDQSLVSINEKNTVTVTVFLIVTLSLVFLLYTFSIIKTVPCGKDILSVFTGNFVHTNITHLISNLYALYALSRVEIQIGAKQFAGLIIFSLIFNTIIETVLRKLFPSIPCSIGFSGVLFSVVAWELVTSRELDWYLISALVIIVVLPSLENKNVSFIGHAVGAVSGVISGLMWDYIGPKIIGE